MVWLGIASGVLAGGQLLDRVGLPSSYLFAAMLLGLAIALTRPGRVDVVSLAFRSSRDYFAALEAKRA